MLPQDSRISANDSPEIPEGGPELWTLVSHCFELPAALAVLNVTYPNPHARVGAIALWGGMNGLAMAVGPTVGGLLVDSFGWRSLFYAVLPFAAATLVLAALALAETRDARDRHLDLPGQILAIVALGALALGFIEGPNWRWVTPLTLGCAIVCIAAATAFVVVERHTARPMLPLSIFRSAAFSAAVADTTLMTFGMYGLLFALPLYFQAVRQESAVLAGVALLPMSLTFFVISPLAGRVATWVGPRLLIGAGMGLTGGGLLLLSGPATSRGFGITALALLCVGLGLGFITGPIATAAMANATAARCGLSSALVNVGRMVGATLTVAALGLVFGGRAEAAAADVPRFLHSMHGAFLMGGTAELLGACIALIWFRRDSLATRERELVHGARAGVR